MARRLALRSLWRNQRPTRVAAAIPARARQPTPDLTPGLSRRARSRPGTGSRRHWSRTSSRGRSPSPRSSTTVAPRGAGRHVPRRSGGRPGRRRYLVRQRRCPASPLLRLETGTLHLSARPESASAIIRRRSTPGAAVRSASPGPSSPITGAHAASRPARERGRRPGLRRRDRRGRDRPDPLRRRPARIGTGREDKILRHLSDRQRRRRQRRRRSNCAFSQRRCRATRGGERGA